MNGKRRVILADVAREAGVSVASASLILNGRTDINFSKETIDRVKAIARELNYQGGSHARQLGFAKGRALIVCPNISNLYYSTVVQAIQQSASANGYDTLIYTTYRDACCENSLLKQAASSGFAGIIFTMMPQLPREVEKLGALLPIVVIGDRETSMNVDTVELNNFEAGRMAARHLLELGHRRIAFVSTPLTLGNSPRARRLAGVEAVFQEAGGEVLVRSHPVSPLEELNNLSIEYEVGFSLTAECLKSEKVTGFVAVNDMVAYGALDAVRAAGFNVPHDYSVLGFDNIFPSHFLPVGLTTVEHHMWEKGKNAFEMLQKRIEGETAGNPVTRKEFLPLLVARDSTAAPKGGKS